MAAVAGDATFGFAFLLAAVAADCIYRPDSGWWRCWAVKCFEWAASAVVDCSGELGVLVAAVAAAAAEVVIVAVVAVVVVVEFGVALLVAKVCLLADFEIAVDTAAVGAFVVVVAAAAADSAVALVESVSGYSCLLARWWANCPSAWDSEW